ncbi:hypothetical protein X907_0249 [Glycocaulis alkaliphilus]|uniref:Uncharacterized protein n=1 Tax=Glycocaulis alkaliphilus TaxID=1434191 RepID=A0A3T0E6F0_9PROT|nr:hypothetical protein [Glycocaulis alkaliphilus]AZU02797.1 hypothetical protein X907_0249 [Glycocaulis alkaliphilus]GGB85261.1 hypothetical protein GCM10007417_26610 [Glycocaulis alkaliphilus]
MFNAQPIKPLNNSPDAAKFFADMSIPTGRKVLLGDASKLPAKALNYVNRAHDSIKYGIEKVAALHQDETRTEVSKHVVAQKIAHDVAREVEKSQAGLLALQDEFFNEGVKLIDEAFTLNEKRTAIHADIRGYIRELSTKEDGLARIREIAGKDLEAAAVLYNTPHYLLGLAEDTYGSISGDLIKKHCPEGAGCIAQSIDVGKAAAKYPKAISAVHRSFYNSALADKGNSRVEH